MKPFTVDMLRAHLLVASFTAMGGQVLVCIAMLVSPVSQRFFGSTPFRLGAVAVMVAGVVAVREFAQLAFDAAIENHHATPVNLSEWPLEFAVASNCPRRWLVILHLRFTGKPFMLLSH